MGDEEIVFLARSLLMAREIARRAPVVSPANTVTNKKCYSDAAQCRSWHNGTVYGGAWRYCLSVRTSG